MACPPLSEGPSLPDKTTINLVTDLTAERIAGESLQKSQCAQQVTPQEVPCCKALCTRNPAKTPSWCALHLLLDVRKTRAQSLLPSSGTCRESSRSPSTRHEPTHGRRGPPERELLTKSGERVPGSHWSGPIAQMINSLCSPLRFSAGRKHLSIIEHEGCIRRPCFNDVVDS